MSNVPRTDWNLAGENDTLGSFEFLQTFSEPRSSVV
jgi:hypothetical protein